MKILKKIIFALAILLIIANIVASFFFYHLSIARTNKEFLADNATLQESVPVNAEVMTLSKAVNEIDWFSESTYEKVNITSNDGLQLTGYYLEAESPTDKTVIIAHGYSSQGTYMGQYARLYHESFGYNVLLPDSRGHGKSEGNYIGFGWIDRLDYLKWIDFIIDKVGQDSQILLHGVSMGGATVLMTGGEELPENVKAIVSDCAYTSVKDELEYQSKTIYNITYFPLISSTSILTKIRAGYFFEEASALEQVSKSKTPTLFIHGERDTFVPFSMVKELYEACSSEKALFTVPEAGHGMSYYVDPAGYTNAVTEFISRYVN